MKRVGYTLIEMLIVLALLGILLAMAFPSTNYFKSHRESLEIKELKRDILYTRNKAIIECKVYYISFDVKNNYYKIFSIDDSVKTKYFEHGTRLSGEDGSSTFIFNTNGNTGVSGSVYFYDRAEVKHKLTITPVSCKVNIE